MASFLADGYTAAGYVEPLEGLHEGLRFRFRPALVEEGSEFYEAAGKKKAKDADHFTARFLKGKLVDWELADGQGNAVDLTEANLLRLNRVLFQRVLGIVLGNQPNDADPKAPHAEGQADDAKN